MIQILNASHERIAVIEELSDPKIVKTLASGDKELSFSYPKDGPAASALKAENYIRTKTDEYVLKEIGTGQKKNTYYAALNVEELTQTEFGYGFESDTQTARACLEFAFEGTGWTVGACEITKRRTVNIEEMCTAWDVLQDVLDTYMCECTIDSINKVINLYQAIGTDRGAYFMEGLNLRKLTVKQNTYDFYTRIYPIGKDGITPEIILGVPYIDNHQYSNKIVPKIWKDERYTVTENLIEDARAKLDMASRPYTAYTADVADLAAQSEEYSLLDYDIGDTVWLVSKTENTRSKQRIVKVTEYPNNPKKNSCELSSTVKTFEQIQQETQEKTLSDAVAVSETRFKKVLRDGYWTTEEIQTAITASEERIATTVRSVRTESREMTSTAESNAKAYADGVASTAEGNAKTYADGKASTAESNAKDYADGVASTAETNAKDYADGAASEAAGSAETNAKTYADRKASTAESNAKTYADGKASTAESNAKDYADSVASTAETNAKDYADGAASTAAGTAETNAKNYADGVASTAESNAKDYADGAASEAAGSAETNAKTYADGKASTAESNAKTYADGKASTAESNAKTYADGKASTAESNAKGYADGVASAAESNAKDYADGAASTAETNAKDYTDTAEQGIRQDTADMATDLEADVKSYANEMNARTVERITNEYETMIDQTATDINIRIASAEETITSQGAELTEWRQENETYFHYSNDGLEIGKKQDGGIMPFSTKLSNTRLEFRQDGAAVAYIQYDKLHIMNVEAVRRWSVGAAEDGGYFDFISTQYGMGVKWREAQEETQTVRSVRMMARASAGYQQLIDDSGVFRMEGATDGE